MYVCCTLVVYMYIILHTFGTWHRSIHSSIHNPPTHTFSHSHTSVITRITNWQVFTQPHARKTLTFCQTTPAHDVSARRATITISDRDHLHSTGLLLLLLLLLLVPLLTFSSSCSFPCSPNISATPTQRKLTNITFLFWKIIDVRRNLRPFWSFKMTILWNLNVAQRLSPPNTRVLINACQCWHQFQRWMIPTDDRTLCLSLPFVRMIDYTRKYLAIIVII